jgi:hypothetical protein
MRLSPVDPSPGHSDRPLRAPGFDHGHHLVDVGAEPRGLVVPFGANREPVARLIDDEGLPVRREVDLPASQSRGLETSDDEAAQDFFHGGSVAERGRDHKPLRRLFTLPLETSTCVNRRMRFPLAAVLLTASLCASSALASDPPFVCIAHPGPAVSIVARFQAIRDGVGTLRIDTRDTLRRLRVRTDVGPSESTPGGGHVATYTLMFSDYEKDDDRMTSERLTAASVVTRVVPVGSPATEIRLFFDGDFHPPVAAPKAGFFHCE